MPAHVYERARKKTLKQTQKNQNTPQTKIHTPKQTKDHITTHKKNTYTNTHLHNKQKPSHPLKPKKQKHTET